MSYWHPVWSRDAPVVVVCCLSWTVWSVFLSWTAMKAKPKGGFRFFLKVHLLLFIFSQSASFAIYFFSKCIFFPDQDVACSQQRCNWCSRILCREKWIWVQKEELGGSSAFLVFLIFSYSCFFVFLVFCCFSDCIFYEIRRLQLLGVIIEQGKRSCR